MSVAKVVWNGKTLVDLTDKTVTSSSLHSDYVAFSCAGTSFTGVATDQHTVENQIIDRSYTGVYSNDRITKLGTNFALSRLPGLTAVYLPNVTNMETYSFDLDQALATVSMPKVTQIKSYCFRTCTVLTNISFPSVEIIGEYGFQGSGLTSLTSDMFPAVNTIYPYAFQNCTKLTTIDLPTLNNFGAGASGSHVFQGCTKLTSVKLPNLQLMGTGGYQFQGCTSLPSIHLSIGNAGQYCFQGCTKLLTAVIGRYGTMNGRTYTGDTILQVVDVNASKVNSQEFKDCPALTVIIFRANIVAPLAYAPNNSSNGAFVGTRYNTGGVGGTIFVPNDYISSYQTATNWVTLNGYGTVTWLAIEGSQFEHYWGDGEPMDGYNPIGHMLPNRTTTGTGVTCVTNKANHVKITLSSATGPVVINLTNGQIGDSTVIDNLSDSLFEIPASTQCKLWLNNILNAAGNTFEINFRKTNASTSASFTTGSDAHTGTKTITQTLAAAEDVSCLYVWIETPIDGTIEFDVAFGVGDNRYI